MAVFLRAFRPSTDKVYHLDLHPTQPWIATADGSDNVVVWDWEHRQVLYEVNAAGIDERRLIDTQLQKLADGAPEPKKAAGGEAIRGGSVKQIKFYDDDVRYWRAWLARTAATESPASGLTFPPIGSSPGALRGRRFLVTCSANKATFLDLVTQKARDIPKTQNDNKSFLCVEFLPVKVPDGPYAAFGGPDGIIRVISMANWQNVKKLTGGHKGAVNCMTTYMSPSGELMLLSGSADGSMSLWSGDSQAREMTPKLSIKAHDGGVYSIALQRVLGAAPQLITTGADKTLTMWDTMTFKEVKRIKPVHKVACHSVASWCHPRAPNYDVLACVKDSNIWAVENAAKLGTTRALCDLTTQIPSVVAAHTGKKLKVYSMAVHPLQPHLVATGTNMGVLLSEFDSKSVPSAAALPTPVGQKEHTVLYSAGRELKALTFQLSNPPTAAAAATSSSSPVSPTKAGRDEIIPAQVRQQRKRLGTVQHDSFSIVQTSNSGKFISIVWPDLPLFSVYRVSDWSLVDTGSAKLFAWDSTRDRYALLTSVPVPKMPHVKPGSSSRKAKAAAEAAAAAAAVAAAAAAAATVEVKELGDAGGPTLLCKSIEGRKEQVLALHGGALLGVSYRMPRRAVTNPVVASAVGTQTTMASGMVPGANDESKLLETPPNFQLYSWETFKAVSGLLPQPEWTAWDPTVELCALAYTRHVALCALRPLFRCLGNLAIVSATGGVWHRRQLFLATPTTIECVFVDPGVSQADEEHRKRKLQAKVKEAAEKVKDDLVNSALADLTVDAPVAAGTDSTNQMLQLRPPMLQVVRLASLYTPPSVPPISGAARTKVDLDKNPLADLLEEKKAEIVVAGGGVQVAASRLPAEQRRPVGPLVVVGVRDGVLWLVDRYMTAHAIALNHPGIRCRCLAAYGDVVSSVKWASRLGREHHDDLAHFMVGMGYAKEALHLPGISKRLEYDLAMQCHDLSRALPCLIALSGSKDVGEDPPPVEGLGAMGVLALAANEEKMAKAVAGVARYAREFLDLIDAADATGHKDVAMQALRRLGAAGAVEGALHAREQRGLVLRLAAHNEMTRLALQSTAMIAAGQGREAAVAAALLNDAALLEKSWAETGMLPEATLFAHAHGRPSAQVLVQQWNKLLQKQQASAAGGLQGPKALTPGQKGSPRFAIGLSPQTPTPPVFEIVVPNVY